MNYTKGDRVDRIEDRTITGAVVLAVVDGMDEQVLELSYDEGGTGWWPSSAVVPADQ
jgi:hypothetical protein